MTEEKIKDLNKEESCNCSCGCECDHDTCTCENEEHECKCNHDIKDEFEEPEEVLVLKNTIENLENKVRNAQAELINYRKRKDEEVQTRLKFANQDLILELLPIADNFERALKLQKTDDPSMSKFLDGFKMLYTSLINTLKNYGVEEIPALGEEFNPTLHEAMLVESDETKEDGVVLEVLIKGYTLKGRVLRASSVKVNKLN